VLSQKEGGKPQDINVRLNKIAIMGRMGQFSMEYMIVIAFGIMAIITIAFVIFSEFGSRQRRLTQQS
jgi:uncharacterized protein (UPF0333 family)